MSAGEPKKEVPGTSLEAYHLGYLASSKGVIKVYNPYPNESELYEWWRRGWETKFFGEDPEVNKPKEQEETLTLGEK